MEKIITDSCTNSICFSSLLRKFRCWKPLQAILQKRGIPYSFIDGTRDIWVRDFMPVQITAGRFVQFRYDPSYLRDLPEYRTRISELRMDKIIGTRDCSELKVDGGNLIKCEDCVIMTDKIFVENPGIRANDILSSLEECLQCEVLLIPHDSHEMTGHADGMLRFCANDVVLLNHYCDFDRPLRRRLIKALSPRFNVVELHFDTDRYLATSWSYINYLQVGKTVIVPAVNPRLDELAQRQLEEYLQLPVDSVPSLGIVRLGGGLNCASWNHWHEKVRE